MARLGYTRVSSEDQSLDRQQLEGCDRIYSEKGSGGSRDRPELAKLLARADEGDEVIVWSMDRLARSLRDLHAILDDIRARGASVTFVSEKLSFQPDDGDPYADFQMHIMGAVAELERKLIRRRQAEGIQKAKQEGRYSGGKKRVNRPAVWRLLEAGTKPADIAQALKISVASVYRIKAERRAGDQ